MKIQALLSLYKMMPRILKLSPLVIQKEAEDFEATTAKAGKNGKFCRIQMNPQVDRRTFCLVNVAT